MSRRLLTLSACAVVLALAGPATAYADSRILVDARGDVWAMDFESGENTQVPQRQQGDIVRTVFAHHDDSVVIRTAFAQLNRFGQLSILAIKLRTNTNVVRRIVLLAGPDQSTNRWRGALTRGGDGVPMRCATHSIDYAADVAVVRIPRACLGEPRWVQGSMAAGTRSRSAFFADNPQNDGPSVRLPRYTARIFRGVSP